MLKISQLLDQHRQALHFLSRTSFHHSSGNIHIPRNRFSFYSLWIIDLKPNYHNRQNVDQLLTRNCRVVSVSNPDIMLGYIYPYYKTYKHWLNPCNCAFQDWTSSHHSARHMRMALVYFPYDFLKPNVDVHLKSNKELLHFRTLTSYHIFPFLKQS